MTQIKKIKTDQNGVDYYSLVNSHVRMTIANLGCRILTLETQDREGNWDDIVLAHQDVSDCHRDGSMLGAVVGRVANRIGGGMFSLGGKEYRLEKNCGPNHIHGGITGFDQKLFDTVIVEDGLDMRYHSADMEEGYPGNMDVIVSYRLKDSAFSMEFQAISDKDTLINLTNHSYFNLSGQNPLARQAGQGAFREKIYDHELKINADQIACVDGSGLPHGDLLEVAGTPFDFNDFHSIGQGINENHIQLKNAGGYDHPYILSKKTGGLGHGDKEDTDAWLRHPASGRWVKFVTDCPVIQLYTANFLEGGCPGKDGKPYQNRDGVALECQYLSNSINIEKDSPMVLRAGKRRIMRTVWTFGVD